MMENKIGQNSNQNRSEMPPMFRITDRSFNTIIDLLGMSKKDFLALPQNSVVLEVGSGTNQTFSRELKNLREDLICISLDPTLAIKPDDYVTNVTDWKNNNREIPTSIYYDNYSENTDEEKKYSTSIRATRIQEANITGNVVAGLAPNLPFKENSVDLVVDSWAAGYYLDKNSDKFIAYISDLSRILRPGGSARLYPVFDKQGFKFDLTILRDANPNVEIQLLPGSVYDGLVITKKDI